MVSSILEPAAEEDLAVCEVIAEEILGQKTELFKEFDGKMALEKKTFEHIVQELTGWEIESGDYTEQRLEKWGLRKVGGRGGDFRLFDKKRPATD